MILTLVPVQVVRSQKEWFSDRDWCASERRDVATCVAVLPVVWCHTCMISYVMLHVHMYLYHVQYRYSLTKHSNTYCTVCCAVIVPSVRLSAILKIRMVIRVPVVVHVCHTVLYVLLFCLVSAVQQYQVALVWHTSTDYCSMQSAVRRILHSTQYFRVQLYWSTFYILHRTVHRTPSVP